jgi:thiamine-phosphate pyrophosphorylase
LVSSHLNLKSQILKSKIALLLLYYITDRRQFAGDEQAQRRQLLLRISAAARLGIDYIQLREKDLSIRELECLGRDAVRCVRDNSETTKLLINSRTDVALAVGADGVHLTTTDIAASEARALVAATQNLKLEARNLLVGVSCATPEAVRLAESHGANFAVLAPVFEKRGTGQAPLGLGALRAAAGVETPIDLRVEAGDNRHHLPVLALGGVTLENVGECIRAGAAGIAAIRLFQEGDLEETVRRLRLQV